LNVGAYSANTFYSRFRHLLIAGGNERYGIQNAVSAAAPVLTGVLALMLEVDPNLSVQKTKDILHQTARRDVFTGNMIPNGRWGYGKLDALAAIRATRNTMSLDDQSFANLGFKLFPNLAQEVIYIQQGQFSGQTVELAVFDLMGKRLMEEQFFAPTFSFSITDLDPGIYLIQLKQDQAIGWAKLQVE